MKNIKLVRGQTYSVNTGNGVVKFVKGEAQQVDDVVAVTLLSRTVVNADGEERPVFVEADAADGADTGNAGDTKTPAGKTAARQRSR